MGFASVGDILGGDKSNDGQRHVTDGGKGASYTRGPAKDPKYEGGSYLSVSRPDGSKETAVFDKSGKRRQQP